MHDPREGLTPDGFITTGAHRSRVPDVFELVLDEVVEAVRGDVAELHLYGSVATGQAVQGRSDVDLLAIEADPETMAEVGRCLGRRFSGLCRGVEIGVAAPDDLVAETDAAYGDRVFLRHYCVPLLGKDAYRSAEPFRGDVRAARGFNGDIGSHAERWREQVTPGLARRVGRKTLLAVAGLVSVADRTWTTDRATAAQRWGRLRPHLRAQLLTLHAWAHGAPASRGELEAALAGQGVVTAVVEEFRDTIGLWSGPRSMSPTTTF